MLNIGCFVFGDSLHHLIYLLPFAKNTISRTVVVIGASNSFKSRIQSKYCDINFIFLPTEYNPIYIARTLSMFDVLLFSNGYLYFEREIRKLIPRNKLLVRVTHGPMSKFSVNRDYIKRNLCAWDALIVPGPRDAFLVLGALGLPDPSTHIDKRAIHLNKNNGDQFILIQSGNLRLEEHPLRAGTKNKNSNKQEKRKIFSMTTYTQQQGKDSLTILEKIIKQKDLPIKFDVQFSIHPNLIREPERLKPIELACNDSGIKFDYNELVGDYLDRMAEADVLLADNTSGSSDFLIFNRPIVFLDATGNYKNKTDIAWSDPCWMYRHGDIISEKNTETAIELIENSIKHDPKKEKREESLNHIYAPSLSPHKIFSVLETHKKLDG